MYMYFLLFPLKTSFSVYTKPLFCLLRHFSFQSRKHLCRGDANGVFVKRGFCTLPKTGGFDENGENDECAFCPRKQGFAPPTPEKDENDENGACHACTGPVCQKPCLHAPDFGVYFLSSESFSSFSGKWPDQVLRTIF